MPDEDMVFKDFTNIKIKSLMGLVDISKNLPYLFNLRNSLNLIEKKNNFTHIFFVDSFDFSKFYLKKYRNNSIKYCQFIGSSVFIWKKNKAKFINRYFDHIFSIFEVERNFYKKEKYSYIGHPILNNIVLDNKVKELNQLGDSHVSEKQLHLDTTIYIGLAWTVAASGLVYYTLTH